MKKPIEPIYRMIGIKIEHIRTTLGSTQQELGKKVGLTRASIANIETGQQRILLHDVEKFSAAFNISPRQFLRGIWT